jgi:general secretion pathway protein L
MADLILARLIGKDRESVEWLSFNKVTASIPVQGSLQDLANSVQNKPVILLLPAYDVLLLAVDLPIKSARQINKALPFILEDSFADDVASYHWVWHRQPKGKLYVAAINHIQFNAYLLPFEELAINLSGVYPESLCVPYQEHNCCILIDHQDAILRFDQWLGCGVDLEILTTCVDKLFLENPHLHSLQIWHTNMSESLQFDLAVNKTQHEPDSPLQLLQTGAVNLDNALNLLNGPYSRKGKTDEWQWRKYLPALAIFILAALIQTGALLKSFWSQKSELAALETQTLALFKQSFPEVKRIVNIKVQAEQQLADLKNQHSQNGSRFMRLLHITGEILSSKSNFHLQQIDFANGLLQLKLTSPEISQLEPLKQQLESNGDLSVTILSAESTQNGLEAHLEIREK